MGSPEVVAPSKEQLAAQADAERRAKEAEEKANKQVSQTARASYGRRTGRRILIAPGREDASSKLDTLG